MVRFYYLQIKLGKITIDNVPARWKDAVLALTEQNEGGENN